MNIPASWVGRLSIGLLVTQIAGCDFNPADPVFAGLAVGDGVQVLVDDFLLESADNVHRVVQRPARDATIPNPLVTGAEDGNRTPYLSVLRDGSRFRMWYNVPYDDQGSDRSLLGYLESADGIHWPGEHRVLPDIPGELRYGASVIRSPDGPGLLLGYHQSGGFKVATSPQGFDWTPIRDGALIEHNHDISGLTYDAVRKQYIAIVSTFRDRNVGDIGPLNSRETQLSTSTDLLNWTEPRDVLVPDAADARATQFYAMDGFLGRGDMLIAMVKVLREDLDIDPASRGFQPPRGMGWTTLAWSRDGVNWTRDREIFLAPDPAAGSWDHAMAWIDEQVLVGDSVYLYYGGYATGHRENKSTERQIGLVRMERDRYVAWEAGSAGGVLRSRLMRPEGLRLRINADAAGGEIRVRATDFGGETLSECQPIRSDGLDLEVECDRPLDALDIPFRLVFDFTNARLFALDFVVAD